MANDRLAVLLSQISMTYAPFLNQLLAALRPDELSRLLPYLQAVSLDAGQLLCAPGSTVTHVHFPGTALVSLVCSTGAGDTIEVAMIGAEGIAGVTFAANNLWTQGRLVVQAGGSSLRLPHAVLERELARAGTLLTLTLRHEEWLKAQMAQIALCSHTHRLDEQVCRWILTQVDRSGSTRLAVTQQHVAWMLGARREGVSAAVGRLQAEGLLHWGRGRLQVMDRDALEARCCECYDALRTTSQRVAGVSPALD